MEARVRDPAHRDQDGKDWRRGRFAERVRREWNPVAFEPQGAEDDLEALAEHIQARVGGDLAAIKAKLEEFVALEKQALPPAEDPLVRPGSDEQSL